MPQSLNYTLTDEEISAVQQIIAQNESPNARKRATALYLLHQGMKPQNVADSLDVSLRSIYKWHARWRAGGLDALANQRRPGAPHKADEAYWQRVHELVQKAPSDFGHEFANWTAGRLIAHMHSETGVELSISRFRAVMRQRGYAYNASAPDASNPQEWNLQDAAAAWLSTPQAKRVRSTSTFATKKSKTSSAS